MCQLHAELIIEMTDNIEAVVNELVKGPNISKSNLDFVSCVKSTLIIQSLKMEKLR